MNFYSQHGEDRLLAKLFNNVGVCVEVGANDGTKFSNTKHFEENGWTCVLVEPTPELCRVIRERRRAILFECAASNKSGRVVLNVADGQDLYSSLEVEGAMSKAISNLQVSVSQISVAARTLDDILAESGVERVDFLTIDVEGHEHSVLLGVSLDKWMPRIVIVEDSTDLGETSVSRHLAEVGYLRFYRTGGNDWYLRRGASIRRGVLFQLLSLQMSPVGLLKVWLPEVLRRPLILAKRRLALPKRS